MDAPVIDVAGSPSAMGSAHGRLVGAGLRAFARERLELAASGAWTGLPLAMERVVALAEGCAEAERDYSPAVFAELAALAEAAGLTLAEAVVANGFTDFNDAVYAEARAGRPAAGAGATYDDCTAFLVPRSRAAGGALFGQTWDMHASAAEHVIVLRGRPDDAPAFVAFTSVGCVGMIGMNEHGVTVGITNLSGGDGRVGVTWPVVVREALRQRDVDAAALCVTRAQLAGAHTYLLLDASGRGLEIEATSTRSVVRELRDEALVHANHCLHHATLEVQRPRDPVLQAASVSRQARAAQLLDRDGITPEDLMEVTRDREAICYGPGLHGDLATCGAVVARPDTREFWVVAGAPSEGTFRRVPVAP